MGLLIGLSGAVAVSTAVAMREAPSPRPLAVDDILEASHAAQGGRARLERIRGYHLVASLRYDTGDMAAQTIDVEGSRLQMLVMWPQGLDYILDVHGGTVLIDQGRIGGERDRTFVTGTERIQTLVDSTFGEDEMFTSTRLVGTTLFEGTPAYEIERTLVSGATRTTYVSQVTFLPIGSAREWIRERTKWEGAGLPFVEKVRTAFSDFREVSGVMIPFTSRQTDSAGRGVTSSAVSYRITL